ncbi:hypothetical protein [Crossiella sp. NPDC003009]
MSLFAVSGRLGRLRARVRVLVGGVLDGLLARGEAELVREFAEPVAAGVVLELAGVPEPDRADVRRWVRAACEVEGPVTPRVWADLDGYLAELAAHQGRARVSAVEVVAGYTRIVDLITGALLTLLGCPQQLAVLRRDPRVLAGVVREVLHGGAGSTGVAGVVAEAAVRAVLACDVLLAGDEDELRWRARLGIRELRAVPVSLAAPGRTEDRRPGWRARSR